MACSDPPLPPPSGTQGMIDDDPAPSPVHGEAQTKNYEQGPPVSLHQRHAVHRHYIEKTKPLGRQTNLDLQQCKVLPQTRPRAVRKRQQVSEPLHLYFSIHTTSPERQNSM